MEDIENKINKHKNIIINYSEQLKQTNNINKINKINNYIKNEQNFIESLLEIYKKLIINKQKEEEKNKNSDIKK